MVTRKKPEGSPARKAGTGPVRKAGAPARKTSRGAAGRAGKAGSGTGAVRATRTKRGAKAEKPARRAEASRPRAGAARTKAAGVRRTERSAQARKTRVREERPAAHRTEEADRIALLQQEKNELRTLIGRLRAERDSALAEKRGAEERLRELEAESARRSVTEPQPAGPGSFDPALDLEEEIVDEDELEGAAGFFDRIDEMRARRIELDRERSDRELEQSEQPFWMICPKCGDVMEEQENENIKVERCETCGGLYLDRGEVDLLLSLTNDRDGLRRLQNLLRF